MLYVLKENCQIPTKMDREIKLECGQSSSDDNPAPQGEGEEECAICCQPSNGQHFGVFTCRPCAAFFKRCVVEKMVYKCLRGANQCCVKFNTERARCRACRLRKCKLAGMEYRGRGEGWRRLEAEGEGPEEGERALASGQTPLLLGLLRAYKQLLARQKALFKNCYGNGPKKKMFVPESAEQVEQFWGRTVPMFLEMFDASLDVFAQMGQAAKVELVEECFDRLNFLNAVHLSLCHFPSPNDQLFLIAHGHLVDMERLPEMLGQWAAASPGHSAGRREMLEAKFLCLRHFKGLPQQVAKADICALMALLLCCKASSKSASGNAKWEGTREAIYRELFLSLGHRLNSPTKAALQGGRLLAAIAQLDRLFTKHKEGPDFGRFREVALAMARPAPSQPGEGSVEHLSLSIHAYRRVWANLFHGSTQSYIANVERHASLEEWLVSRENVLSLHNLLPPKRVEKCHPLRGEEDNLLEELGRMSKMTWHPRFRHKNVMYRLMNSGLLQSMPLSRELPVEDQIQLNCILGPAIHSFMSFYLAAEIGANSVIGPDSVPAMETLRANKMMREDDRLMKMAVYCFVSSVSAFQRVPLLSPEECAILIAILCSHPAAISELSKATSQLLYEEQVAYSQLLMGHLQAKLGPEKGARRYADCLHLVNVAFHAAHNYEMMRAYLEAFYSRQGFTAEIFPKCLVPLV